MDGVGIILEFDSDKRSEIEKDIYSKERDFVDFNILLPCPQELEEQISGSPEDAGVRLIKNHEKSFDLNSPTIRDEIRDFVDQNKREEYFLTREQFDAKDMESVINSVIAYQKYGYANWLEFKRDKWGVSQNAFAYEGKKRSKAKGFYFVTGWSIPTGWLQVLSAKWPDVEFKVYAKALMEEESRGGYVNLYLFKNGAYRRASDVKRKF